MPGSAHFIHVTTCDLKGIVFLSQRKPDLEALRRTVKAMEVRPELVFTPSDSQTCDFSTKHRISFAIKSSALSFFLWFFHSKVQLRAAFCQNQISAIAPGLQGAQPHASRSRNPLRFTLLSFPPCPHQ